MLRAKLIRSSAASRSAECGSPGEIRAVLRKDQLPRNSLGQQPIHLQLAPHRRTVPACSHVELAFATVGTVNFTVPRVVAMSSRLGAVSQLRPQIGSVVRVQHRGRHPGRSDPQYRLFSKAQTMPLPAPFDDTDGVGPGGSRSVRGLGGRNAVECSGGRIEDGLARFSAAGAV